MAEDLFIARLFWTVGCVLAALGAVLWFVLPIRSMFPPYLGTALLALVYGAWCWRKARAAKHPKS